MTFAEKLQMECIKQGTYPNTILAELKMSRNSFSYWKKSGATPAMYRISQIADKLGISQEELLEGVDGVPIGHGGSIATVRKSAEAEDALMPQEKEIIDIYRSLNVKKQAKLLAFLIALADEEQV